jgi:predicted ABC-type ATPase
MPGNPQLYIIAGPNGAGKTTFAKIFLPKYAKCSNFVNADHDCKRFVAFFPKFSRYKGGKITPGWNTCPCWEKSDFAFETTLSDKTHLSFLEAQKNKGYSIYIFFLWLLSVEPAVNRIKDRVEDGEHYVKSSDVKRRFPRSIRNFFNLYMPLADSWYLFENSAYLPHLIAKNKSGQTIVNDAELFKKISEKKNAG